MSLNMHAQFVLSMFRDSICVLMWTWDMFLTQSYQRKFCIQDKRKSYSKQTCSNKMLHSDFLYAKMCKTLSSCIHFFLTVNLTPHKAKNNLFLFYNENHGHVYMQIQFYFLMYRKARKALELHLLKLCVFMSLLSFCFCLQTLKEMLCSRNARNV